MPKRKAIGYMCGKVAKIIHSVLKTGVPTIPKDTQQPVVSRGMNSIRKNL